MGRMKTGGGLWFPIWLMAALVAGMVAGCQSARRKRGPLDLQEREVLMRVDGSAGLLEWRASDEGARTIYIGRHREMPAARAYLTMRSGPPIASNSKSVVEKGRLGAQEILWMAPEPLRQSGIITLDDHAYYRVSGSSEVPGEAEKIFEELGRLKLFNRSVDEIFSVMEKNGSIQTTGSQSEDFDWKMAMVGPDFHIVSMKSKARDGAVMHIFTGNHPNMREEIWQVIEKRKVGRHEVNWRIQNRPDKCEYRQTCIIDPKNNSFKWHVMVGAKSPEDMEVLLSELEKYIERNDGLGRAR